MTTTKEGIIPMISEKPTYSSKQRIADHVAKANAENYNWDELVDFIVDYEYEEIANNLLHLYFVTTEYYLRDGEAAGPNERLNSALSDLKERYKAIKAIRYKAEGVIILSCNNKERWYE